MKAFVVSASLAAALLLNGTSAHAENCKERALTWVTALEQAFTDLEGIAQGDFDELQLDAKLLSKKKTADGVIEKFRVTSDHTNEDDESWTLTYDVTFLAVDDLGCFVQSYKLVGIK